jgi:hypothetical protein
MLNWKTKQVLLLNIKFIRTKKPTRENQNIKLNTNMKEDNILIAEFMGIEPKINVADWSEYDEFCITDAINEFTGHGTIKLVTKGDGIEWLKVKHQNKYKTIFTDGTWCYTNPIDIEVLYDGKVKEKLDYHTNWNTLMPVVAKIRDLSKVVDEIEMDTWYDYMRECLPFADIDNVYLESVNFIKFYNNIK